MEEKEKTPTDYFKGVKVPIKHIVKYNNSIKTLSETAIKANKIVVHTLQFLKLYLLDYYDMYSDLPKIDKVLVNSCMKTICKKSTTGRPPSEKIKKLKDSLNKVYINLYKPLTINDKLDYKHMNTILDYLTIDIVTMYENNIKQHYIEYVERYVNVMWKKKQLIEIIRKQLIPQKEKERKVNHLCNQLRKIKNDLLNVETKKYTSYLFYHTWINQQKKLILPYEKFKKNSIYYDLQCDPQKYFSKMLFMLKQIENNEEKVSNVFPLRSNIIPKHIRIDTTSLIHLLFTKEQGTKSFYLTKGNLKRYEDKIWNFFFRTERQCFKKKKYSFHHMIETDGISATILFLREDLVGKKVKVSNIKSQEKYIDEIEDYDKLKNKKIVAIDPNMSDLIYCVDGDTKDRNYFRYTQDQRRKATKQKKYRNILFGLKKEQIEGKTITEWETLLSDLNRKSLTINNFSKYVKLKNNVNEKLFGFYENYLFRKLKLNSYINILKSEKKLINQFKRTFGNPEEVVIGIGDFEQRKHRKFKEPVKGKGFRTLFRKNGYDLYLVDEFRTSCKCSYCEGDCRTFRKCHNPRPWKDSIITRHGLLACKTCKGLWNRDENSSRNIYKIIKSHIDGLDRPEYLRRKYEVSEKPNYLSRKLFKGATSATL